MQKMIVSGNGTLPPVLWVGARLEWRTPLASTDEYLTRYWRTALTCLSAHIDYVTAGLWETEIMTGLRVRP